MNLGRPICTLDFPGSLWTDASALGRELKGKMYADGACMHVCVGHGMCGHVCMCLCVCIHIHRHMCIGDGGGVGLLGGQGLGAPTNSVCLP